MKQESNRQRTMEDIGGGLHPAVDVQSLGERRKVKCDSLMACYSQKQNINQLSTFGGSTLPYMP